VLRDFGAEIEAAEKELEAIKSELRGIRQQFLLATTEFVRQWYRQQVEDFVKRNHDLTKKLAGERLSELKADLVKLENDTSTAISEHLDVDELWWQAKEVEQGYGAWAPNLDKPVRLAAGRLAIVLEKYGYLASQGSEVWREWDKNGDYHPPGARPYYPYSLDWSQSMRDSMKGYRELCSKAFRVTQTIRQLKQEKASSEAEELWRKA
jgi:hypothetical protein